MTILRFHNVTKTFPGQARGVQNISLTVERGEFTVIAGPSGAGKSTLLNLAAGFDSVSRGRIDLFGHHLGKLSEEKLSLMRRKYVGFIFQTYNLFPVLNTVENVEYPLALLGVDAPLRRQEAVIALRAVGMESFALRKTTQLSPGQQQRVAIARSIVTRPKIIFADEPTANLDVKSAELLLKLFQEMNQEGQTTFLFSSHDPQVLNLATRVIQIVEGTVTSEPNSVSLRNEPIPAPDEPATLMPLNDFCHHFPGG